MTPKSTTFLFAMALLLGTVHSRGAFAQVVAPSDLATQIDQIVAPYAAAKDFMGVIAIQQGDDAPLISAHGLSSIELGTAHHEHGVFMIGSVSKQFTAAAILLLEDDEILKTSDVISKFLPEFGSHPPITIHQALAHTSGIGDIYSLKRFGSTGGQVAAFEEVIQDLAALPLTHDPGSRYAYSNGGYAVLAAVIERVSGTAYGEFLKARIFEPLGLRTMTHDPGPARPGPVPGYAPWGSSQVEAVLPIAPAFLSGSGSLWSSAEDLLRWNQALHGGELLSPTSYAKFTQDHGNGYGYGVSVFTRFGRDVIGHDGRVAGYASDLAYYPNEELTVAVLSNVESVARDEIRQWIAAAVFGEDYALGTPREFASPPTNLAAYVGQYAFGPNFIVSISVSSGRLLARANQGGFSELTPLKNGDWFSRMLYATVRFERDADGAVSQLVWGTGEGAPAGKRLN
ncbi:MAG: serine hydrolase [Candidatus Eisenbacteria bacterium]|uniref:Serine hydrolase n=1 Tax=Eiseniibacteriota bacterium TaxID=2212470 RepID=A0A7Y2E8Y5_UNCEI|nr:serine hydrolase [Candidatus Eisenbacteria bacterium]